MEYDNVKFQNVSQDVYKVMSNVLNEHFPELLQNRIKIKCFFLTQMVNRRGKVVLAQISKADDRTKLLTHDQINSGYYDYVMDIDKNAWQLSSDDDKIRIIRHELRHIDLKLKGDGTVSCGLKAHDIQDFKIEIQLNDDNMDWGQKLAFIVETKYQQQKQIEKEIRKNR